jgi:uncharacterized repeat protein (TIGR03806 family)
VVGDRFASFCATFLEENGLMKRSVGGRAQERRWLGSAALGLTLAFASITCTGGGESQDPLAGASGTNGASGVTGASGTNGSAGVTGAAGVNGASGVTGAAGVTGASGTGGPAPCPNCVEFGLQTRPANPTCLAGAAPPQSYKFVRIWNNVTFSMSPLGVVPHPNGTELIVFQKNGVATAVPKDPAATTSRAFLTIPPANMQTTAESGLLGMAFSPKFATDGFVYVVYSRATPAHATRVARFKAAADGKTLDVASETKVYEHVQRRGTHHGGDLHFGADGYLYVAFGDDNSGDYMDARFGDAANPKVLYGKVLRLDVNVAGEGYKIPADNPYAANTAAGAPEVWARGFRNPWRFSFDRQTKELWLGDPGEETNGNKGDDGKANPYERINKVVKGGFYGWPYWQGSLCYRTCNVEKGLLPEFEVDHMGGPAAIVGGYVYRGAAIPSLVGKYIFGDYEVGQTYILDTATKKRTSMGVGGKPTGFGEDLEGELYVTREGGVVEKLQSVVTTATGGFPMLLSQTGCVMQNDVTKPVPGMIPFSVMMPLWSDGADKERFVAVPDGQTISVAADGDFTLPPGGVTMKIFKTQGKAFETRFFVRHNDGSYMGYTYEWNDAGTDATKVGEAGKDKTLAGGLAWTYPSQAGCFTCHSEAAGRNLGLETRQLNSPGMYSGGKANQFNTLKHIGLLSGNMNALAAFPAKDDAAASIESKARAYLAVNCSNCHRPNGPGRGAWSALYDTAFKDMGVCNAVPEHGTLGVAGATLVKPGAKAQSLLYTRPSQRTMDFMPPLGTKIIDPVGVDLLGKWIDGITACP